MRLNPLDPKVLRFVSIGGMSAAAVNLAWAFLMAAPQWAPVFLVMGVLAGQSTAAYYRDYRFVADLLDDDL